MCCLLAWPRFIYATQQSDNVYMCLVARLSESTGNFTSASHSVCVVGLWRKVCELVEDAFVKEVGGVLQFR